MKKLFLLPFFVVCLLKSSCFHTASYGENGLQVSTLQIFGEYKINTACSMPIGTKIDSETVFVGCVDGCAVYNKSDAMLTCCGGGKACVEADKPQ